jgi:hypothetical protein
MNEATKCEHIEGKTADDCEECRHFVESAMGHKSGYCWHPAMVVAGLPSAKLRPQLWMNVGHYRDVGPYRPGQEERFKQDSIRSWESNRNGWRYFCIESPGTADGFPDVLAANDQGEYFLWEFKVSDAHGVIHFQNTQPLFYRKNSGLNIWTLAWSVPSQRAIFVPATNIAAAHSLRYPLPM